MYAKPIKKELSVSELQCMVEQGMTRGEICKVLEISPNTLRRYLGPGKRGRIAGQSSRRLEPVEKKAPVPPKPEKEWPTLAERLQKEVEEGQRKAPEGYVPPKPKSLLGNRKEHHTICLDGTYATYEIDVMERRVRITTVFEKEALDGQQLAEVIEEMQAIQRELRAV